MKLKTIQGFSVTEEAERHISAIKARVMGAENMQPYQAVNTAPAHKSRFQPG
jgi:hypothetical protein